MIRRVFAAFLALSGLATGAIASGPDALPERVKVVYHVADAGEQPMRALRNLKNHLAADPSATLKVVALAHGLQFLALDAEDPGGNPYEPYILELQEAGVTFLACSNTLRALGLRQEDLVPGVVVVPSGVAEIGRLQAREGYAYLRP